MVPLEFNISPQAVSFSLQASQLRISSRAYKLNLPTTVNSLTSLASLMELTLLLLLLDMALRFLHNNRSTLNQVLMPSLVNSGKWV